MGELFLKHSTWERFHKSLNTGMLLSTDAAVAAEDQMMQS